MTTKETRNIGIFAHIDAGKTTTTEHMLFESGTIRTLGSVDQGTALTDSLEVERERGISVRAAATTLHWKGIHINVIDTPGHVDFLSEVERSMRVMDGAILIVSAAEGVQSQTETVWHALRSLNIPTLIYVNKMDRTGVSAASVLDEIKRLLSPHAVPLQISVGEAENFAGMHSILDPVKDGELERPEYVQLVEACADVDEELLFRVIEGEPIAPEELRSMLARLTRQGRLFPVLFGSSQRGIGIRELLDHAAAYLPGPTGDNEGELSGVVFKIERDKTMGRAAYVRLYNGTLRNRDAVRNLTQDVQEKVTQIRKMDGRKFADLGELHAGDIAAVYGLSQSKIGDILGSSELIPLPLPSPYRC